MLFPPTILVNVVIMSAIFKFNTSNHSCVNVITPQFKLQLDLCPLLTDH